MTTQAFKDEVYSEGTGQAYLMLLTINHAELAEPLRFTSDGVATLSNSNVYSPAIFSAVLPDNAQGREPQAAIRIGNVNRVVIETLRGLQSSPTIDMAVIRASDPDTIEEEYTGMTIAGFNYDVAFIDLTLVVERLSEEPFPPRVFDLSWEGVFPS